jgi:hypothetical protein
MKVICINAVTSTLTPGKIYETICLDNHPQPAIEDNTYYILNDVGLLSSVLRVNFITLEQRREEKLKQLGI